MFSALLCTSRLSGGMDTTNLRMCRYNLKIVHQHRMDRLPMVLQELPKGLHSYISLPRYASMKSHVDNVLLQVYMVTRRLRYLTLVSSCILVLSLFSYFVLLLIHIQDPVVSAFVTFHDLKMSKASRKKARCEILRHVTSLNFLMEFPFGPV